MKKPKKQLRYDVKSIADRYFAEQCFRLGPINHPKKITSGGNK